MLPKFIIEKALSISLENGADFAEIFIEDTLKNTITMTNDKMEAVISGRLHGYGLRVFSGTKSVYAYSGDLTQRAVYDLAKEVATALGNLKNLNNEDIVLKKQNFDNKHNIVYYPAQVEAAKKAYIVTDTYKVIKGYDPRIIQANVTYLDVDRSIIVANSEGTFAEDRAVRTRLVMNAVASNGKQNQTGNESPGRSMGFEMFEKIDVQALGESAAKTAITMLSARECPSGVMPCCYR